MNELLATKLTPPHLPSSLVSRDSLLTRLDDGLSSKLTLLSAPAGSGKTTLATDWSAKCSTLIVPVAWVSLDSGDNDPVRFWRYVITACQQFTDAIGSAALTLLQSAESPP